VENRRAFTLVELLITITIIGIMAGMVLFALFRAQETAKAHKTRALIAKLDAIIKDKWQTYQYRRVPLDLGGDRYDDTNGNGQYDSGEPLVSDWNGNTSYDPQPPDPRVAAKMRLDALRDLMRMELPDRWSDIIDFPAAPLGNPIKMAEPAVHRGWMLRGAGNDEYQNAECLYLIVMDALASDDDARSVFKPDNIRDTDSDGKPEFIDGWGMPIRFLRWPAGFRSDLQTVATGYGTTAGAGAQSVNVTVTPVRGQLSTAPGAYIGGTIAVVDQTSTATEKPILGNRMARITGYSNGVFTCTTPSYTQQQPFGGNGPNNEPVVIMGPDPFDSSGVYPLYNPGSSSPPAPADTSIPSFAVYPLIYSAGPNKCYGIASDFATPLHYADPAVAISPFTRNTENTMIGTPKDLTGEPNFVPNGWLDNIHNHLMGLR
jgi:prepilin-type N-terminal cleavage/methylation domain-containing protein